MKKLLALYTALCFACIASAQITAIKSNVPVGADPAALNIEFLPVDALALPNGDIQMGVALELKVRNIGTKNYLSGKKAMPVILYQLVKGNYVPVKQINLPKLLAGETQKFNYYTTYILGKEQPPSFRLQVHAQDQGVPQPDVNLLNNRKAATAQ